MASSYYAYTVELKHSFSDRLSALIAHNGPFDGTIRKQKYSSLASVGAVPGRSVHVDVNPVLPNPNGTGAAVREEFEPLLAIPFTTLIDYRNRTSTGGEFQVRTNLRRNWTMIASFSTNQTEFTRFFPLLERYLTEARATARARHGPGWGDRPHARRPRRSGRRDRVHETGEREPDHALLDRKRPAEGAHDRDGRPLRPRPRPSGGDDQRRRGAAARSRPRTTCW